MFTAWGGRKVSEYLGNVFWCGKSGFTVNQGVVNRGFTELLSKLMFSTHATLRLNSSSQKLVWLSYSLPGLILSIFPR